MIPAVTMDIDVSVVQKRFSDLSVALFGSGHDDGMVAQALKTECGQLAGRIGDSVGAKTQADAKKRIEGDIKSEMRIVPKNFYLLDEAEPDDDMVWLQASQRSLLGINREDLILRASQDDILEIYRAEQKSPRSKPRNKELGMRGVQHVYRYDHVVISKSVFLKLRAKLMEMQGVLRAAFYSVAVKYVPSKRIPAWVERKIEFAKSTGRSQISEFGMNSSDASIEFTIVGKGLESNPRLRSKIQGAIKGASMSMAAKLEKIAKGAKYIFETGQVYFDKN